LWFEYRFSAPTSGRAKGRQQSKPLKLALNIPPITAGVAVDVYVAIVAVTDLQTWRAIIVYGAAAHKAPT
jgi:hypothetical protein